MKLTQLALFVVLASVANSLVSAKDAGQGMAIKPTEAPLMMSTARPTAPPKINKPTPTKAMNYNVPPKIKNLLESKEQEKMPEIAPLPDAVMTDKDPMIAMESNEAPPVILKSQEIYSHKVRVGDIKPVQVTGFITRNGNIYEIEGKDGIGLIEGRQSTADDQQTNVCNYGSVVIYSDVPCDKVTNVKVGEVEQNLNAPQESAPVQSDNNSNNNNDQEESQDNDDLEDFNENGARRRKQQQNRNRRRNRNGNRRRNGVQQNGNRRRQGGNQVRRKPVRTQQQRRQQQKKRQQMQQQQKKRRQQQQQWQQNRNRKNNRRNQGQNQQKQNRRKVAQRQQEDEYSSLDDDQDGYEYEY